jgi:hypothetical protein
MGLEEKSVVVEHVTKVVIVDSEKKRISVADDKIMHSIILSLQTQTI